MKPRHLLAPTEEQVKGVIGELDQRWSRSTLKALDRLDQAIDGDNGLAAKYWATVSGIGTDKILPIRGMPTTIVSNIHEFRADIGPLMDKLAGAARVLQQHVKKGYKPADVLPGPALSQYLDAQNLVIEHTASSPI